MPHNQTEKAISEGCPSGKLGRVHFDPFGLSSLGAVALAGIAREKLLRLPNLPVSVNDCGWEQLVNFYLEEELFGPNRYSLSSLKQLYYHLKPLLPRSIHHWMKVFYKNRQEGAFPLRWPIEDRFVTFIGDCVREFADGKHFAFWPENRQFAFVITHDVETAAGLAHALTLAQIEHEEGFRSAFNFVPERYAVDPVLRERLIELGFEVGVHGLSHDGKLFFNRKIFDARAAKINGYLKEWNAVGFRSPLTHRNPEWMQNLDIQWDSSFFDTDPYEPMPGGTMTIWPFFIGHFVELPYTLPQDSTLFLILGETNIDIWKRKVDWIAENRGMILVNVHPDYIDFGARGTGATRSQPSSGKYPFKFYLELLDYVKKKENYWHALPREVAAWWRTIDAPHPLDSIK